MWIVHAGNRVDAPGRATPRFPAERAPGVAQRLGSVLDLLRPTAIVTAAAAGADLLLIEEAVRRGLGVHIVLPTDPESFGEASVADCGSRWTAAYQEALRYVSDPSQGSLTVVIDDRAPDPFRAGNEVLIDRATSSAPDGVLAVVVRPAPRDREPSVTDDFAARALEAGLFLIEIDPLSNHA